MSREHRRTLIIGSGPAGYTAAIYASRANLSPLLYEGLQPGGQLTQTTEVENFPGYPEGVTGTALIQDLRKQAERFGTEIRSGLATAVDLSKAPYLVTFSDGKEVEADTIIISTGDGFFYRGKKVAVVGGGDTACEEAIYLAGLASHVYMIVRKDYLRASKIMRQRVEDNPKITILYEHNTLGLYGEDGVEGAHLVKRKGQPDEERVDLPIDGFFLAIGHHPNSELFAPWVDCDAVGYIQTEGATPRTKVPGVFAAGDVADPLYRQAITAAGSGCKAAIEAERYLSEHGL